MVWRLFDAHSVLSCVFYIVIYRDWPFFCCLVRVRPQNPLFFPIYFQCASHAKDPSPSNARRTESERKDSVHCLAERGDMVYRVVRIEEYRTFCCVQSCVLVVTGNGGQISRNGPVQLIFTDLLFISVCVSPFVV